MPNTNIPHRFNWRKNPHPSPQAEQPPADAGEEIGEGPLFQGMRHDPSVPLSDFAARDFSPALKAWMQDESCGYVDGLNMYNAPVDDPVNPINPLGT